MNSGQIQGGMTETGLSGERADVFSRRVNPGRNPFQQRRQLTPREQREIGAFFTAGVGNVPPEQDLHRSDDLNTENWSGVSAERARVPEFGEIVDVTSQVIPTSELQADFNAGDILTEGDNINKKTLRAVQELESRLAQDGDLNRFYTGVRGATVANLRNSFGRELGEAA